MFSVNFLFFFIPLLSIILIAVNLLLAPHVPYKEKKTPFECGYHSFLLQNRTQFTISYFVFALLFLLFDLEIVMMYPFSVSMEQNGIYGLTLTIGFIFILTAGFVFELGKGALIIESRQNAPNPFRNLQILQSKTTINSLYFTNETYIISQQLLGKKVNYLLNVINPENVESRTNTVAGNGLIDNKLINDKYQSLILDKLNILKGDYNDKLELIKLKHKFDFHIPLPRNIISESIENKLIGYNFLECLPVKYTCLQDLFASLALTGINSYTPLMLAVTMCILYSVFNNKSFEQLMKKLSTLDIGTILASLGLATAILSSSYAIFNIQELCQFLGTECCKDMVKNFQLVNESNNPFSIEFYDMISSSSGFMSENASADYSSFDGSIVKSMDKLFPSLKLDKELIPWWDISQPLIVSMLSIEYPPYSRPALNYSIITMETARRDSPLFVNVLSIHPELRVGEVLAGNIMNVETNDPTSFDRGMWYNFFRTWDEAAMERLNNHLSDIYITDVGITLRTHLSEIMAQFGYNIVHNVLGGNGEFGNIISLRAAIQNLSSNLGADSITFSRLETEVLDKFTELDSILKRLNQVRDTAEDIPGWRVSGADLPNQFHDLINEVKEMKNHLARDYNRIWQLRYPHGI